MSRLDSLKRKFFDEDDDIGLKRDDHKKHSSKSKKDREKKKKKKDKKEKKLKKKKSKQKHHSSSSSSSSSENSDEWVEKKTSEPATKQAETTSSAVREDWMAMTGMFSTYTKADLKPEKKTEVKKANIDDYKPGECSRELNPYWKNGGTGLPSEEQESKKKLNFLKPDFNKHSYDRTSRDDHYKSRSRDYRDDPYKRRPYDHGERKKWKKYDSPEKSHKIEKEEEKEEKPEPQKPTSSKVEIESGDSKSTIPNDYMTPEQMNAISAKILKAELMGNTKLKEELTKKLEAAREYKKLNPQGPPKEAVMLTVSDTMGRSRPLSKPEHGEDPKSKSSKKRVETHASGERMKYFADDDKYNLKQMFEKEKYSNANDDDEQFAKILSKSKNPNDDLDDIFTENITKNKSKAKTEAQEKDRAIAQHISMSKTLENCENCIESSKMVKHMIVSLNSSCYVALPTRKSLTEGHCVISTNMHTQCSTLVDEDSWAQIMDYRRALTNMFDKLDQDVVFFEYASHFNRHPHMVIHCIPLPREMGDVAPIYFKKALLECETEWSNNKKVIDLKGKDVRRGVPKGLPYFWVDFGMSPGFAHVIEDQQLFPANFAQEIIGGMLDLDHDLWRKPSRDSFDAQRKKVLQFEKNWKSFDIVKKE